MEPAPLYIADLNFVEELFCTQTVHLTWPLYHCWPFFTNGHKANFAVFPCTVHSSYFCALHARTHTLYREDDLSAYYQEQVRQAKQIMTLFTLWRLKSQVLSQLPAKVSSTVYCQLTETVAVVQGRGGEVNQGRHGKCLQGNVVCWEIVASLCCGLVVREAVGVV